MPSSGHLDPEIGSVLEDAALAVDADRMRASIEDLDRCLNAVQVE